MTGPISLAALRAEFDRLQARLAEPMDADARAEAKQAIVTLFRQTETAIAEYAEFKESIRELVDRFKALPAEPAPTSSVRHDHIGATTWIERGWTALAGGRARLPRGDGPRRHVAHGIGAAGLGAVPRAAVR